MKMIKSNLVQKIVFYQFFLYKIQFKSGIKRNWLQLYLVWKKKGSDLAQKIKIDPNCILYEKKKDQNWTWYEKKLQ